MRYGWPILLPIILTIVISACSGPVSNNCPPMGNITGIDKPESPLKINNLLDTNMPNFNWDSVDCSNLQTLPKSLTLSQFIGNPVFLVFHKSMNCPGCKYQLPFIQSSYEKYKNSGLVIITIYRGDKPKEVKGYIQSNKIDFMALADPNDIVATKLGFAVGAPMTVFIDKKGAIKKYQIGPLQSQAEIENILKTL